MLFRGNEWTEPQIVKQLAKKWGWHTEADVYGQGQEGRADAALFDGDGNLICVEFKKVNQDGSWGAVNAMRDAFWDAMEYRLWAKTAVIDGEKYHISQWAFAGISKSTDAPVTGFSGEMALTQICCQRRLGIPVMTEHRGGLTLMWAGNRREVIRDQPVMDDWA